MIPYVGIPLGIGTSIGLGLMCSNSKNKIKGLNGQNTYMGPSGWVILDKEKTFEKQDSNQKTCTYPISKCY